MPGRGSAASRSAAAGATFAAFRAGRSAATSGTTVPIASAAITAPALISMPAVGSDSPTASNSDARPCARPKPTTRPTTDPAMPIASACRTTMRRT